MPTWSDEYVTILIKVISSLVVILLTLGSTRLLRKLVRKRVKDQAHAHALLMLGRNGLIVVGTIIVLAIWLGSGANLTVAMGILGAGIAFASQEVIGSFAGYVNILSGGLYQIGDRVRIGNVVGDVVDISVLRTAVMESGEWVGAEQYSGRVVSVANRVVFSDPVYNYTKKWPYLWDEIMLPVSYESDWRAATEIMLRHARDYTDECQREAQPGLDKMVFDFGLQETTVDPAVYVVMTDNWIELTLRYVVRARDRRQVQAQLHEELLREFEAKPDITVASATFEIVGFPPLRREADGRASQHPPDH
jgi:small-conductance mechanosensitive channel